MLRISRQDGREEDIAVRCRIDTPIEIDYYQHGGILPYVLRHLIGGRISRFPADR
jgi:aconitate hydratase